MPTTVGKLKALSNLNIDRNRMAVLPYEVRCSLESLSQSYSLVTCITMPGARRRGRPRTAWMDNIKTWPGLSVEESIRMTEDRNKWRKYVHGVANPRIEDGYRTEQNFLHCVICVEENSGVF